MALLLQAVTIAGLSEVCDTIFKIGLPTFDDAGLPDRSDVISQLLLRHREEFYGVTAVHVYVISMVDRDPEHAEWIGLYAWTVLTRNRVVPEIPLDHL